MRQLFIPTLIIFLLIGLFLPIPEEIIDYLVIFNVILAVMLLFSVLLVEQPTKLTTLPSFLLILTLFRLVTNISTTRQILRGDSPGELIPLIGESLIQGNLIIGLVIFGILTLVQLLVVSKGAERVAEVSARFVLDALPGKQMSIDADVRAGLIDFNEARLKRQETQVESRFYGALDGAMKFIKGDAIVGILITLINLLGGFAVGVISQNLSFAQAISYYSLLTIGDGVISQIPAILNAIAAGILVTRVVASEGSNLAQDLTEQLFSNQGVKLVVILISIFFACLPAVPSFPFLLIGLIFTILLVVSRPQKNQHLNYLPSSEIPKAPLLLKIKLGDHLQTADIERIASNIRVSIYQKTGFIFPYPNIEWIKKDQFDFLIEVRGQVLTAKNFSFSELILDEISQELSNEIINHLFLMIDDRATRGLLDLWEVDAPEQVHFLIPNKITVTRITSLLKDLVMEGLYPKNFDLIMQTIAENIESQPTNVQLLNLVRQTLKYHISDHFSKNKELLAITIDHQIDSSFFQASVNGKKFNLGYLTEIVNQIKSLTQAYPELVVISSMPIRRFLWQCLVASGLKTTVLAYEEILPEIQIKSIGHIVGKRTA